jgi:hypothetical protein
MMTDKDRYSFDLNGYLYIEDAIDPDPLAQLRDRVSVWEERRPEDSDTFYMHSEIINRDETFLRLVANPRIMPYLTAMMEFPRLRRTWVKYVGPERGHHYHGGRTAALRSYGFFNGQIITGDLVAFYAVDDIGPGMGGLQVIPGSHKANFPLPEGDVSDMHRELTMKAGSCLLFTHDLYHGSFNSSNTVRRVIIFWYNQGEIESSRGLESVHENLFEQAPEGSWAKYLLRRAEKSNPNPYPMPVDRPFEEG